MNYWNNIDADLTKLLQNGYVKLPSIFNTELRSSVYRSCLDEIAENTYAENLPSNIEFVKNFGILENLKPKLFEIGRKYFSKNISSEDVYNICRLVRPGDENEGYRGHFDSHLFTLVTPINIPDNENIEHGGQLHIYPKARPYPKNEVANIYGKARYKSYNSEKGFEALGKKTQMLTNDFNDYRPLLFIGNTTFHGNSPIQSNSIGNRMTILTHFFDPSPRFGVGRLVRKLRKR